MLNKVESKGSRSVGCQRRVEWRVMGNSTHHHLGKEWPRGRPKSQLFPRMHHSSAKYLVRKECVVELSSVEGVLQHRRGVEATGVSKAGVGLRSGSKYGYRYGFFGRRVVQDRMGRE